MLKQTVTYTDFDDNQVTETLYFHISKTKVAIDFDLQDELQLLHDEINAIVGGPEHQLDKSEIRKLLEWIKRFIKLSYGERSADGKHFNQSDEAWERFTQTAVYDAFLYSLFEDVSKAAAFITGIVPPDLREEVEKAVAERSETVELFTTSTPAAVSEGTHMYSEPPVEVATPENQDDRPAWIREDREPTPQELRVMTNEQLQEVYRRKLGR